MGDGDEVRLKKAKALFEREIECKHGRPATDCAYCKNKDDLLNSRTRTGTVRDAIHELVKAGLADAVEAYHPVRDSHRRIPFLKIATVTGALFVGSAIVYETGKVVLHLIRRVRNSSPSSGA